MRTTTTFVPRLLGALALCAAPALAVDGVIEINQARALAGGITAGDSPGFPVTISVPGSYRLTSHLDVTGSPAPENRSAIQIAASFVSIDLNGFSLVGPTVCSGSPVTSCSPSGTGSGIQAFSANFVRIVEGIVRGFGGTGIVIGNGTIERVQAYGNGGSGIHLSFGGSVSDSAALGNGEFGITGFGVLVDASRALENGASGISGQPAIVRDCEAVHNGGVGIWVVGGLAMDNVSRANLSSGIEAQQGGGVARNAIAGAATLSSGVQLAPNLCNSVLCP